MTTTGPSFGRASKSTRAYPELAIGRTLATSAFSPTRQRRIGGGEAAVLGQGPVARPSKARSFSSTGIWAGSNYAQIDGRHNASAAHDPLQIAAGSRSDNQQDAETYASDREGLALTQAPAA